jgi:hypothetical protein
LSVQDCNMYFMTRIALPGTSPERVVAALVLACLLLFAFGAGARRLPKGRMPT